MITLEEHAKQREQVWLETHPEHIYPSKDLLHEAREELADACNYINACDDLSENMKRHLVNRLTYIYNNLLVTPVYSSQRRRL